MSGYYPSGPTGGQPYPIGFQSPAAHSAASTSALGGWAGPIGAGIGAGADLIGGFLQSKSAKDAAQDAYARQIHWAKHGPSYQMEGLRNAGLNPILAAGKIGGASGSQPQAQPVNPTQGAVQAAATAAQLSLLGSQAKTARAQALQAALEAENTGLEVAKNRRVTGAILNDDAAGNAYFWNQLGMRGELAIAIAKHMQVRQSWNRSQLKFVKGFIDRPKGLRGMLFDWAQNKAFKDITNKNKKKSKK